MTSTPPFEGATQGELAQSMATEHTSIRALVARLNGAETMAALGPVVESLLSVLPDHFAHEEAEDGVFAGVRHMDPSLGNRLDVFVSEHADLSRQLDALRDLAARRDPGAFDLARQLSAAISAHEAAENEVVMNAFYDEIGDKD